MKETINKKLQKENNIKGTSDLSLSDFVFIGNHVLLKAIKITSNNGLAKPKQKDDKPEFGTVISVGETVDSDIRVGDIVLFGRYVSEQTDHNGETYYFVRCEDIKGYLKRNI